MLHDYSLDLATEKIHHPKTKEYFQEVISSYNNRNYRSAIVSLYTVVITDLIYKLKDLVDREEDPGASRILEEVEAERTSDSQLSKWEYTLIKRISERTKLLELHDIANISALKDHRNLCAHPSITQDDLLFTPNKETTRAHIRNMLEGILTKHSMFTTQVLDSIILKIPGIFDQWVGFGNDTEGAYERVIIKRYLQYLNDATVKKLFRTLWKFTFRLNNEESEQNRNVNAVTLQILQKQFPHLVYDAMNGEREHYSNIDWENPSLFYLTQFFQKAPRLYHLLDEDTRKIFEERVSSRLGLFIGSWFITANPEDHLQKVIDKMSHLTTPFTNDFRNISELTQVAGMPGEFNKLIVRNFSKSSSYSQSYDLYRQQVRPALKDFNEEDYEYLFSLMNESSQITGLFDLSTIIAEIQEIAEETIGHKLDISEYSKLK
ncbi:hypothetical protein NSQ29_01550 [Paenibacillus sp. FSL F4-0236]|uniref:hypothetical protein n=1 Tax=Paenibacillus sp. FSL F4-0236 TaxID=2954731 RepID=UPI0030F8A6C6